MNVDMVDVSYCSVRGGDGYQCAWDHTCFGDAWGHHCTAPRVGVEESQTDDETPHQIHSYTLLFSLFLYFLYIVDPPLPTTHSDCM